MTNPVPDDPTIRATEIVDKGLAALRELLEAHLQAEHDLCAEKFRGIDQRFADVESRTREQKEDTKGALTDALTAAGNAITLQTSASEKAIDKSEQATAKELAQMAATFGTAIAGLSDKLDGQKDQERKDIDEVKAFIAITGQELNTIRSIKAGAVENRAEVRASTSAVYAAIGLGITLVFLMLALAGFALSRVGG